MPAKPDRKVVRILPEDHKWLRIEAAIEDVCIMKVIHKLIAEAKERAVLEAEK